MASLKILVGPSATQPGAIYCSPSSLIGTTNRLFDMYIPGVGKLWQLMELCGGCFCSEYGIFDAIA